MPNPQISQPPQKPSQPKDNSILGTGLGCLGLIIFVIVFVLWFQAGWAGKTGGQIPFYIFLLLFFATVFWMSWRDMIRRLEQGKAKLGTNKLWMVLSAILFVMTLVNFISLITSS